VGWALMGLRRGGNFRIADRTIAVLVDAAEDRVRDRLVVGAERILEFRLADRSVAVGIEARKQLRLARRQDRRGGRGLLLLGGEERAHRLRAATRLRGRR